MATRLKISNNARFQYRTTLDSAKRVVRFHYNSFAGVYFVNILTTAEELLLGNIALVYGVDLLAPFQHIVTGSLVVTEPSNSNGNAPTRDDFRTSDGVDIVYDATV